MKKSLAILLIAVLSFNPTQVWATEDASEPSSVTEEISDSSTPASADVTIDSITPDGDSSPSTADDSPSALDGIRDTTSQDDKSLVVPEGDMGSETSDVTLSDEGTSDEEAGDEEADEDELNEDELDDPENEKEHEHEFVYKSNGDGTHTVTCSAPYENGESEDNTECPFESIEECSYDENNKCIYCGYEKEPEFDPSISIGIDNKSCVIGKTNPIIKLYIYQKSFNIEYAQICFANDAANNYINMALTRGKYFEPQSDSFVPGTTNNWYACPNIDSNYSPGDYHIRSIYVRSTDGDTAHYSVESKTLEDKYKRICITVKN